LLAENERLRHNRRIVRADAPTAVVDPTSCEHPITGEQTEGPVRNPLFDDRPWFYHISPSDAPHHVTEAADGAFATRFRQALSDARLSHIPRTNYPSDDAIFLLANSHCPLPSPGRARFLLMAALKTVSECYHVVLKSAALEDLEKFLQNPTSGDIFLSCKIWALLAIGEVYTVRSVSPGLVFPGLAYFAQAMKAMQVTQERPSIESVEIRLLLVRLPLPKVSLLINLPKLVLLLSVFKQAILGILSGWLRYASSYCHGPPPKCS